MKRMVNGIAKALHTKLHKKLIKENGNAAMCEMCHNPGKAKYQWALKKDREYSSEPDDYFQLCVSCHRKYDFTEEIRTKLKAKKQGEIHNTAILTNDKVREIRELILSGKQLKQIADDFGVHPSTIHNIKSGKRWKHLI